MVESFNSFDSYLRAYAPNAYAEKKKDQKIERLARRYLGRNGDMNEQTARILAEGVVAAREAVKNFKKNIWEGLALRFD